MITILVEDIDRIRQALEFAIEAANIESYDDEAIEQLALMLKAISKIYRRFAGYALEVDTKTREVCIIALFRTKYFDTDEEPEESLTHEKIREIYDEEPRILIKIKDMQQIKIKDIQQTN